MDTKSVKDMTALHMHTHTQTHIKSYKCDITFSSVFSVMFVTTVTAV